jgi:hypothetical protein
MEEREKGMNIPMVVRSVQQRKVTVTATATVTVTTVRDGHHLKKILDATGTLGRYFQRQLLQERNRNQPYS